MPLFAGVWAIFGHGNVAGMGEALYAARDELPTFRAHNEQAMAHAAIAFAKASRRRRMMACTTLDRAGRDQHGHRRRRWRMSTGCRCCCCRATSSPAARPIRCCSRSRISATARSRPTTASGRCRATSTASPGPSRSCRRCRAPCAVLTDPADCGPVTLALLPGRAGRGLRLSRELLRRARLAHAAGRRPMRAELATRRAALPRGEEAADHRRRRRALSAAPRSAWRAFAERARHAGGRDAGRQVRPAVGPPAEHGLDRRHRHRRRQRGCRGGRRGAGRRHAAAGFHHRLVARCSAPARDLIGLNVAAVRRRQARARCRWWPTPRSGSTALARRSAAGARRRPGPRRRRAARRDWRATASGHRRPTNAELPSDAQVIGAVQRRRAIGRDRGLRRRRPAGRAAQAVAGRRAGRLPRRIRLFLHGLRDRRRARREDGRSPIATLSSWSATAPT